MFVYLYVNSRPEVPFILKGSNDTERSDLAILICDGMNSEGYITDENDIVVATVDKTPGAMNGFTVRVFK